MDAPDLARVLVAASDTCQQYPMKLPDGIDAKWPACHLLYSRTHCLAAGQTDSTK